jgi:hypothetical protein
MNTRTNFIITSAGLLLAIASATPSAVASNLLVDPGFTGVPPLISDVVVIGPPIVTGQWGAENAAIVGVDGGVTPLSPPTMLAEYAPGTGVATQTFKATDVSAYPAGSAFTLSANFDANQNLPAAHAFVDLSFYDASSNFLSAAPATGLVLDSNAATWQQISMTAIEPLNTKYVLSQVYYANSTLMDSNGVTYPSYVDDASLTVVPEPSALALLATSAFGLLGYTCRWSKWTKA